MSLCATGRAVRRTWTVELRPQHGGPLMACPHCPPASRPSPLGSAAVRSTLLGHLAGHARRDALPVHLRTCQCHEHGCQWHPRHRGCSGPIALVLTCAGGGRLWRLADACTACARATPQSAIVPENMHTAPTGLSLSPSQETKRLRARASEAPVRVREMLSYLAAALPVEVCSITRLLAIQCALRANALGRLWVPLGLLRGMRMHQLPSPWRELEQAGWLVRLPVGSPLAVHCGVTAQLLDATVLAQAPGRLKRAHAADGALRLTSAPALRTLSASDQLAGLALATHISPGSMQGAIEADRIKRMCAFDADALTVTLDRLVAARALDRWSYDPSSEDITWTLGTALASRVVRYPSSVE